MYFGIKYEQKLKSVNKGLQTYGSSFMMRGKANYYFKNPLVALRVVAKLNSSNKNFSYSVYELDKEETNGLTFIKSYSDYENYINEDRESELE